MSAIYRYNPYLNTDVDVDAPPEYSAVYDGDHLHVFYNDELVETKRVRAVEKLRLRISATKIIANKMIERYIAEGEA